MEGKEPLDRHGNWRLAALMVAVQCGGNEQALLDRRAERDRGGRGADVLAFALLHLVVNVGALLFSATAKASGLASLWDVGAIGGMSILTFAACYWILDRVTPGGAFLIPGRDGRLADPKLFDYIYLSFDTSTTFGPTLEVPVCRRAKALMMLQVALSIVILTVLLSRAVNAVG
jgi:uncharacterized membrane protein